MVGTGRVDSSIWSQISYKKQQNLTYFFFLIVNLFSWISTDHIGKILGEILGSVFCVVSVFFLDVCLSSELCIWESAHACVLRKRWWICLGQIPWAFCSCNLYLLVLIDQYTFMTEGHWVLRTNIGRAPYLLVWPCFLWGNCFQFISDS